MFAPAAERNARPILGVIEPLLEDASSVLEIGSGTGQHAVFFGQSLPWLTWQSSDVGENLDGIRERIAAAKLDNVPPPLELDVFTARLDAPSFDAVFSANTAHIMNADAVASMFAVAGRALRAGGRFLLYGPFRVGGAFTTPSNELFDDALRRQDPEMGIRDLELLDGHAGESGLQRRSLFAMPSNNFLAVWAAE